jgi:hypothetical protein
MEEAKRIELTVRLTLAKVEIFKLKADEYTWSCHVKNKDEILNTLADIDRLLLEINPNN